MKTTHAVAAARLIGLLLAVLTLASGCFGPGEQGAYAHDPTPLPTPLPTAAVTQAPTEAVTESPTEAVTDTPTAEPADTPAPTAEPADTPSPTAEPTKTPKPTNTPKPTAKPTNTPKPTAKPTNTPKPTAKPTNTPKPSGSSYVEPPHHPQPEHGSVPTLKSKSGKYSFYHENGQQINLFRVDNATYEQAFFVKSAGQKYAGLVNYAADALSGKTNVYSLIIPTNFGVVCPDDIVAKIPGSIDMESCIKTELSYMSSNVKKVSCIHDMLLHRDEFLYFRTDHHWTALGAYYAYRAFCRTKGISHIKLTDREEIKMSGFLGSSWSLSGHDSALLPRENVYAYYPVSDGVTMVIHDADGSTHSGKVVSKVASYMCFAGGDNPLTVFTNPAVSSGKVLIIIKESFGNALLPFLVDHYGKIYEIDYRYWKGNVISLANEVGATDLIFANNFAIVSSNQKIAQIAKIVK
ncbi:MAG: hypothetical protein II756_04845 [Clostridia bacterium]|nr:hypothetical protein [Clostridia bacterium]